MNCILFPTDAPLTLDKDSPKLEHIKKILKTKQDGEVFAGNINGALNICTVSYNDDGSATLTPVRSANNPYQLEVGIAVSKCRQP